MSSFLYSIRHASITISKYEGLLADDLEDGKARFIPSFIVIKNQPFFATLSAPGRRGLFLHCTLQVSLNYYDDPSHSASSLPVTFVNTYPIEYKSRANADGTELEVEASISALSSQHSGSLFCVIFDIQETADRWEKVATAPLKVVSKADSLSATIPIDGKRKTLAELLGVSLNKLELSEAHSTKMISLLCKEYGIPENKVIPVQHHQQSKDLGAVVRRLCSEYRAITRNQRAHRLLCEIAGLMDDELDLLSKVNQAFCDSFQKIFDANYEMLIMQGRD